MSKKKRRISRFSVSPLFILLAAVMAFRGEFYNFAAYTAAVILHELAHAEVSGRLGYTLISLKLAPYGAALTGNYETIKPRDEIKIAVAGPLFNLFLAIPAVALWWVVPQSYYFSRVFVDSNLMIALFNLLPIFPLDGGRVLLAALSLKMQKSSAYKWVRICGIIFALILAALFVATFFYKINFSLGITALFMLLSSIFPDKKTYYERLYSMAYKSQRIKNGLVVREIMVSESTSLIKLTKLLSASVFTKFVVVDCSFKPIFSITETQLEEILLKNDPKETIKKACITSKLT